MTTQTTCDVCGKKATGKLSRQEWCDNYGNLVHSDNIDICNDCFDKAYKVLTICNPKLRRLDWMRDE